MRLISNEELVLVAGSDGNHEIQPITAEELEMDSILNADQIAADWGATQMVFVEGYKDRDNTAGEFACHTIAFGIGLMSSILLIETGPIVVAAAQYIASKVDEACVEYIYKK